MKKNPQEAPLQNAAYQQRMRRPKLVAQKPDQTIYRLYPPIGDPIQVDQCQPMKVSQRKMEAFLTHNHYKDGGLFVHLNELDRYLSPQDLVTLTAKGAAAEAAADDVVVEEVSAPKDLDLIPPPEQVRVTSGREYNAVKKYLIEAGEDVEGMSLEEMLDTWEIPEEVTN